MSEPKPLTPEELADPEAWLCACGEDCMEFRLLATITADRTEIARLESENAERDKQIEAARAMGCRCDACEGGDNG